MKQSDPMQLSDIIEQSSLAPCDGMRVDNTLGVLVREPGGCGREDSHVPSSVMTRTGECVQAGTSGSGLNVDSMGSVDLRGAGSIGTLVGKPGHDGATDSLGMQGAGSMSTTEGAGSMDTGGHSLHGAGETI